MRYDIRGRKCSSGSTRIERRDDSRSRRYAATHSASWKAFGKNSLKFVIRSYDALKDSVCELTEKLGNEADIDWLIFTRNAVLDLYSGTTRAARC